MNKETIEIPLMKATYEELQQVICELQIERYKYKSTIDKIKEFNKSILKERWYGGNEKDYAKKNLEILEEIE